MFNEFREANGASCHGGAAERAVRRAQAAAAAVAVSSLLMAGVVALFGAASATPWLAPTPDNLARWAACDRLADRGERTACVRSVVASAAQAAPVRVATVRGAPP